MKIIDLEQGSAEWKEFRRGKIGASDSAIVKGESPFETPYSWWKRYMDGIDIPENFSMNEGKRLEPIARDIFGKEIKIDVHPRVCEHDLYPHLICSLDGISDDHKTILEIKCGGEKLHHTHKSGEIPAYYWIQVQKQIAICRPTTAYFMTYFKGDYFISIVEPDDQFIQEMIASENEFHAKYILGKEPPKMSDRDYDQVENLRGSELLKQYQEISEEEKKYQKIIDELKERKDAIKGEVSGLGCGRNFILDGIKIYQQHRSSYDMKAMKEDGIDVDMYKKSSTPYWQIALPRVQKSA